MTRDEELNRKAIEYSFAIKDFMVMCGAKEESAKSIAKMVQLAYMTGAAEADANPINLWKPADGEDLPEIDREVIVLTQPYPLERNEYAVSFAHRPNPNGWDGKSVTTGEIEHYTPKTYGKCGWNIPDIILWLDVELPKEIKNNK